MKLEAYPVIPVTGVAGFVIPAEVTMPTRPCDMTDLQLDITLEHCYARHAEADKGRRAVIHQVIVDVLAEQKTRRDERLGLSQMVTHA